MNSISTVARNEQVSFILEQTRIPFQQYPMVSWSLENGFDVEKGDEHKSLLEHVGNWTPEQRQAVEQLFRDGTIKVLTIVEDGSDKRAEVELDQIADR